MGVLAEPASGRCDTVVAVDLFANYLPEDVYLQAEDQAD